MSLEAKLKEISLKKKKNYSKKDWDKERALWIKQVNELYCQIEKWLKIYIDKNYISLHFHKINLFEESMGEYDIDVLETDMGELLIVFRPVGRNIIGADGRIDVYPSGHTSDKKMLILIEDELKGFYWELWETSHKKDAKIFDCDALEKMLEDWLKYY